MLLAFVGLALFAGFISLGTWQVQRRSWKLALIERIEQRVHSAPTAAPQHANWPQVTAANDEYRPVYLSGQYLYPKTVLTQAVTELGAGFWVITPLQTTDGTITLINRGFLPEAQRKSWLENALRATASPLHTQPTTVIGLMRMSEPKGGFLRQNDPQAQRWHSRDVQAIAASYGLQQVAPYFVDAGLPSNIDTSKDAAQNAQLSSWPKPGMTMIQFHNSHLVYALTWYGMALMVVIGGWLVIRNGKNHAD